MLGEHGFITGNLLPRAFPFSHFLREKPWGRGWDLGAEPPRIKLPWVPPGGEIDVFVKAFIIAISAH